MTGLTFLWGPIGTPLAEWTRSKLASQALTFQDIVQQAVDSTPPTVQDAFLASLSTQLQSNGYSISTIDKPADMNLTAIEGRSYGSIPSNDDAVLDYDYREGYCDCVSGVSAQAHLEIRMVDRKTGAILYQARIDCCTTGSSYSAPRVITLSGPNAKFVTPDEFLGDPGKARGYLDQISNIVLTKVVADLSMQ